MCMISISSKLRDYTVQFGDCPNLLQDAELVNGSSLFIIDDVVWELYRSTKLSCVEPNDALVFHASEDGKAFGSVGWLYDQLVSRGTRRNTTVVSIGGGILQDVSGFVASTLYRGIKWIFLPTTLLAQADSCIGGKTSLNFVGFKNLIGTFYPPFKVFVDVGFLKTQKDLDFYSGLGEVIKLHVLGGQRQAEALGESLPGVQRKDREALLAAVSASLRIKREYIVADEFDMGIRALLNYGHCFGHALEAASHFAIPHGQAVVLGMLLANIVARNRALLDPEQERALAKELLLPGLVCQVREEDLDPASVLEAMKHDKKRTREGLVVVVMENGWKHEQLNDVLGDEIIAALAELRSYMPLVD